MSRLIKGATLFVLAQVPPIQDGNSLGSSRGGCGWNPQIACGNRFVHPLRLTVFKMDSSVLRNKPQIYQLPCEGVSTGHLINLPKAQREGPVQKGILCRLGKRSGVNKKVGYEWPDLTDGHCVSGQTS